MSAAAQSSQSSDQTDARKPLPIPRLVRTARYAIHQGSRVALYTLHSEIMRRINKRVQEDLRETARAVPNGPVPSQKRMLADIAKLFAADLQAVEDGHYPTPSDGTMSLSELVSTSRAFFKDVPNVARRRAAGTHQEINDDAPNFATSLPRYYRQNFHFQTDGWLSEDSARIYDFQVDVLFSGATAAMRRTALVPFSRILRHKDQRKISYVDIACGTGGLLRPALKAFPRLKGVGLDLSEPYLNVAKKRLKCARASYVTALAENLPFPDKSLDVVSCVFLFHELPPSIRRKVIAEIARVLKPGGTFLFVDSLQTGDVPDYDGLLSVFPQLFHEPYYTSYLAEDFRALCAEHRLEQRGMVPAFVSRMAEFVKPH